MSDVMSTAVRGRRTVRLGALTAGLLVSATVFAALWVGLVSAIFILSATGTALATLWSWLDEGRPKRFWVLAMVLLAAATVFLVVCVDIANIT